MILKPTEQKKKPAGFSQFWTNMLLMAIVLALALLALTVVHQLSIRTLKHEKISEIQAVLERDAKKLGNDMYTISSVTDAIGKSHHYQYIRSSTHSPLPGEHYPILALLADTLRGQAHIQRLSEECLVYFPNANAIISRSGAFPIAEDCFKRGIIMPETDTNVLIGYLKSSNLQHLLPLQRVTLTSHEYQLLPLVMCPTGSRFSVMAFFRDDMILSNLGMEILPEGTCMQIIADTGQLLMSVPKKFTVNPNKYTAFTASLAPIQASVTVYVLNSEIESMLKPVADAGAAVIAVVTVAGLLLTLILSRVSVAPLRKLLSSHAVDAEDHSNEISALDFLLSRSREREQDLRTALTGNMLAKAFSGVVLSDADERFLQEHSLPAGNEYRAVILTFATENTDAPFTLPEKLRTSSVWAQVTPSQFGLLISASEDMLESLKNLVDEQNSSEHSPGLRCGVSAPFVELEHLATAIRQARFSCPPDPGLSLFQGHRIQSHIYSRLQHERLYQAIFANDSEGAMNMLEQIGQQLTLASAREIYYNVRFTLRSAAEEMELDMDPFEQEYMPHKRPRENLATLREMVENIFQQMFKKSEGGTETLHQQILDWFRDNACDPNMCAAAVAEQFNINEKKAYEIIRTATDMSLNEYLLSLRMKTAGKLLYSTQLSVAEVGQRCGYPAESTFFRVFRKYYGISPSQYRKNGALTQE